MEFTQTRCYMPRHKRTKVPQDDAQAETVMVSAIEQYDDKLN